MACVLRGSLAYRGPTAAHVFRGPFLTVSRRAQKVSSERTVVLCLKIVMRAVRNRLSWLFTLSLVLQLAGVCMPLVLSAADPEFTELCTCPGGTHGATCPMHHGKTNPSPDQSTRCTLRSATLPTDLALLTLVSGAGIIPPPAVFDVAEQSSAIEPSAAPGSIQHATLPDSPPPRA